MPLESEEDIMQFHTLPALAIAFGLSAATTPPIHAQEASEAVSRNITVSGSGRVEAKPDIAHVNLGVSETAETAEAAVDAMAAAMKAVLARLGEAGIAPADIRTGQLSLDRDYARMREDRPEPEGFVATTMVEVRVTDLDALGSVLDAVVGEGANRLSGVQFELSQPEDAMAEARRAAVADARAKAELYAEASGVTLGKLLSLNESGGMGGPQPMMEMRMAADSGIPVPPGQVTLEASVTVVYAIE